MKISVGTDIIEIERIKNAIQRNPEKFLNSIYSKSEIEYCESKKFKNIRVMRRGLQPKKLYIKL